MASTMSEDIIMQILLRSPVTSLLRFRSVSKSWYSLISSGNFITAHRNHINATGKSHSIVFRRCGPGARQLRCSLHTNDASLKTITDLKSPSTNPNDFYYNLGSINGLICFRSTFESSFIVWNPVIRKSLYLRGPYLTTTMKDPKLFSGFGFDPSTDDYKIIRGVYDIPDPCIEIYSLRSRSWSRIHVCIDSLPLLFSVQVYLNGVVHWIADADVIIGFDFRNEKFLEVSYPCDSEGIEIQHRLGLDDWCGLLAVISNEYEESTRLSLWVMNEYGDPKSWTKQCVISCVSIPKRVKGFTSNGTILIEDSLGLLLLFDPRTREAADLNMEDIGDVHSFYVKVYKESLTLLVKE